MVRFRAPGLYGRPTGPAQPRAAAVWIRRTTSAFVPHRTFRLPLVLTLVAAPAFAQPGKATPPAGDDMAAFEKDLDALFVKGGLTAETAASRAGAASPTVRRRIAEVDAAIAQAKTAELARVPQIGAKVSYTRLSYIAPLMFGPTQIPFLQDAYLTEGSVAVPLSDYIFRIPKLIAGARLAEDVALTSSRSAEVVAGEDARLSYYEWVRAR